jgi:hypothetical protein
VIRFGFYWCAVFLFIDGFWCAKDLLVGHGATAGIDATAGLFMLVMLRKLRKLIEQEAVTGALKQIADAYEHATGVRL